MNENKKVFNNKTKETKKSTRNKNEKKNFENSGLTYTMGGILDELFPEFKPSKKEENK